MCLSDRIKELHRELITCERCPRLVAWRERVAAERVRRFAEQEYWGKPIPGFGDPNPQLLIVGLAPAAHGANRTGRMFTGDRSGDWLYRSLHKFGFASQAESTFRDDGLSLKACYITAAVHCAPPQNKPTSEEKNNCFSYLLRELDLFRSLRVIVTLGKIGFDTTLKAVRQKEIVETALKPKFGHGIEWKLNETISLIASYHPSQQNTFTGKLTESMFDSIFRRARKVIETQ